MRALRLVVNNPAPTRAEMIDSAVKAAAYWCWPFGVWTLGMRECLEKQIADGDMNEFAREVRFAFDLMQSPEYQKAGAGGFK